MKIRYEPGDYQIDRTALGCAIHPYNKRQSYEIEKGTYTYDHVYRKKVPYVGFLVPVNGVPTYLTYNRSYDALKRSFPYYIIETKPIIPGEGIQSDVHLVGIKSMRPAQTEILGEIDRLREENRNIWFVNLQTNEGKTLLSINLMTQLNQKTMVLCYSNDILRQWYTAFYEKTNLDPNRIIRLTGPIITNFLAGKLDYHDYDVYLTTPELLDIYANKRQNYGTITDLFNLLHIGFTIYDEAHRNVGDMVKIVSLTNVRYQIYLSADFAQGDSDKERMFLSIFRDIPVLTPSDELRKSLKYTQLVALKFNTYPNTIEAEEPFNKYGFNASLYMKYEFKKGLIQEVIQYAVKKFMVENEGNYRMLILFYNVEHVMEMTKILKEKFPQYKVGCYHSSLSDEEKTFSKDEADIIVATYGSFSTGLDTQNIKYVISCNQCNKVQDNQAAGRARRLADGSNAYYIMLVDTGFSYTARKLKVRLHYLMETKSKDDRVISYTYHPDMHRGEN